MKFLLASLKTLTTQMLFRKPHQLSFALIGQFFLMYFLSRLSEQNSESQAGFGTAGGYQKAGTSTLKRVTGRISQLVPK
jgi:hypothetical protein